MAQEVTYPDVTVKLTGESGNAFSVIGAVQLAIQEQHGYGAGAAFANAAMDCTSYDELLAFAMATVHVR